MGGMGGAGPRGAGGGPARLGRLGSAREDSGSIRTDFRAKNEESKAHMKKSFADRNAVVVVRLAFCRCGEL